MADFFQTKLVHSHIILKATKPALMNILRRHPLLTPTYQHSGVLSQLKEFCAALLWVDAASFSVQAIKNLPAEARATLCTMLGLTVTPVNASAQADRIMHFVRTKRAAIASRATTQVGGVNAAPAGGNAQGGAAAGAGGGGAAAGALAPISTGGVQAAAGGGGPQPAVVGGGLASGAGGGQQAPAAGGAFAAIPAAVAAAAAAGGGAGAGGHLGAVHGGQPGATQGGAPGGPAQPFMPAGPALGGAGGGVFLAVGGGAPVDCMVSPGQLVIIGGLAPAIVQALVTAAQVPCDATDSDHALRCKLVAAVWAAEVQRTPADLRALADAVRLPVMAALGINAAWVVALQDAFSTSAFNLCRQAPWVLDPSLSHGLLTADRMALLALVRQLQTSSGGAASSRARMATLLSPAEFIACEQSLQGSGRSFDDIVWTGNSWSLKPDGAAADAGGSGASAAGATGAGRVSLSGGTSGVGTGSTVSMVSGFSPVLHMGVDIDRAAQLHACEEDYRRLRFDVYSFLTPAENQELKARSKALVGTKRERAWDGEEEAAPDAQLLLPLASFPWNQSLKVLSSHSLAMLGRFLRIALTFCTMEFLNQMTCLLHHQHEQEVNRLYNDFVAAARDDYAAAVCLMPRMLAYAGQAMKTIQQEARARAAQFPESGFFASMLARRMTQAQELDRFMDEVLKRVTNDSKSVPMDVRAAVVVGMWQEFFGGWMAAAFSGIYCDEVRARWSLIKQTGFLSSAAGSGGAGQRSPGDGGAGTRSASPPGGGSGGGVTGRSVGGGAAGAASGSAPAQELKRTIPCAIDVVGDTLGVPSTMRCMTCKPAGRFHHGADCPKRWAKILKSPLPGFTEDGTRDESQWKDKKEPIKATIEAWITMLQDHTIWNGAAPVPAGVPGAPTLEDFQRRLARAPVKP